MARENQDRLVVGSISGLYGVKGWVKIFSHTRPRENILDYSPWLIQSKPVVLEQGRVHGKGIVAKLSGVDDRDAASLLLQQDICIRREQLPTSAADEYYWVDLVGLKVINQQDIVLGDVSSLFETGANDVLVVKGDKEHLIPFLPGDVILDIDLDTGIMQVDWDADF
ncbi:ribosome maturation factor RimM [Candidatus Venteria ishoeyi]|uniref:Ribosome maturation factor RimM n=1 Tax=Candidatus Venteria ishoeyi TaxID=1899563 RepID=A0A1H6FEA1_9GAMM|nr:ribosome maturation factor RimM [Candidatus Venteria ishoeyi]MDM8546099.1 ribosome maturation factor RimM [Candidatus Venteria ishoeyi]SEH07973.1 Ribosome maturation factor RimM [Candidatus Venteria ishoeyi]